MFTNLHALRVLRAHGMSASALPEVFLAMVIAKLCYASSAWWGFSTAGDNQRVTAFIRRSIRQGYCATDHADIKRFIDRADDTLFFAKFIILTNTNHVSAHLLPEKVNTHYQLRPRQHVRSSVNSQNYQTVQLQLCPPNALQTFIDCSY